MTASKVYLISGSNRGIGLSLVKQLSERPNTIVIATARQPEKANELKDWIKHHENVHLFKYDAGIREDAFTLATEVEKVTDGVDVLIANGAIADSFSTILNLPDQKWLEHYQINVLGPIFLFKAFYNLLKRHETRQVIFISSSAGSITQFFPTSSSAYGQSKAALNYSMKEISFETKDSGFTVISLHPGVVSSDMGKSARIEVGKNDPNIDKIFESLSIAPDDSAASQIKVLDSLTIEDSGKFFSYDGTEVAF